jgi:hypothetical protein
MSQPLLVQDPRRRRRIVGGDITEARHACDVGHLWRVGHVGVDVQAAPADLGRAVPLRALVGDDAGTTGTGEVVAIEGRV